MEEPNPIVLLAEDRWHIVEHSRRSQAAMCGKRIRERRAHARLKQVSTPDLCPNCLSLWTTSTGGSKSDADH